MVYHVLKDGTVTKDITGRVVKMSDAEPLYNLMVTMNSRRKNSNKKKEAI